MRKIFRRLLPRSTLPDMAITILLCIAVEHIRAKKVIR